MQSVFEFIIPALLAGFVLYKLYAVLGRRVGRQPEDAVAETAGAVKAIQAPPSDAIEPVEAVPGLADLKAKDPTFRTDSFLAGARVAYEMVVRAFASGDRAALRPLLSESVMRNFETAMAQREAEGSTESVEFIQPPRADLEQIEVDGEIAKVTVRFLGEYRSRTKGAEGEGVDDRRTAELWTLERPIRSKDPNWILTHVAAATA